MGYEIVSIDRTAIPTGLLDLAKQHMRVRWNDEDDYITNCILRAVDLVERHSGASIFATEVNWTPVTTTNAWGAQFPLQPVDPDFDCIAEGDLDVTDAFHMASTSPTSPVLLVHTDMTPFPAGLAVGFTAGFATADLMPPQYLDPILRIAAHLYEHRESVDVTGLADIPQWMNDLLMGNWIPRA